MYPTTACAQHSRLGTLFLLVLSSFGLRYVFFPALSSSPRSPHMYYMTVSAGSSAIGRQAASQLLKNWISSSSYQHERNTQTSRTVKATRLQASSFKDGVAVSVDSEACVHDSTRDEASSVTVQEHKLRRKTGPARHGK
ncbi:hypothetical protein EXIGLDRAFT_355659 [Exidia glandulosa HHB12029]|uniref:Uncharacterized protein n=1 Tax=Exidia glandulosa HHB12029 TaxID=1314781 RepID=A0A165CAH7_EXIGL|nr:hypothetical protein EXIGLDRAFT_355659 [Exidia glandulosa HHB12029]